MKIKKYENFKNTNESLDSEHEESINNVIEHYFVRQHMEIKDINRKQGDGKIIPINGVGIIKEVKDWNNGEDIAYLVEFEIDLENSTPWSKKSWTTHLNTFYIFHNEDNKNIVRVF